MRHNYCDRCLRKQECIKLCNRAEQIAAGRKKKEVELIFEREMTGEIQAWWNELTYGVHTPRPNE